MGTLILGASSFWAPISGWGPWGQTSVTFISGARVKGGQRGSLPAQSILAKGLVPWLALTITGCSRPLSPDTCYRKLDESSLQLGFGPFSQ